MSLGTLSESRIAVAPTATPNSTVTPDSSKPNKNTQQVLENTVVNTTTTAPTNATDGLVTKPTPEPAPATTPAVVVETPEKPCSYCMAKSVTSLAFQISMVLLVLAFSFHLVKKV